MYHTNSNNLILVFGICIVHIWSVIWLKIFAIFFLFFSFCILFFIFIFLYIHDYHLFVYLFLQILIDPKEILYINNISEIFFKNRECFQKKFLCRKFEKNYIFQIKALTVQSNNCFVNVVKTSKKKKLYNCFG